MSYLLLLLLPLTVLASEFGSGEIYSISFLKQSEETLIKFTDGTTGFLESKGIKDFSILKAGDVIEYERDENLNVTVLEKRSPKNKFISNDNFSHDEISEEVATIFPTYGAAQAELNGFNAGWIQDSQCYNRSHVWAYEGKQKGTTFQKAFLFFSDSYIERYRFPWWFHNSTYALVNMRGMVEERVMDKTFSPYPLKFKLWTDLFMKNKVECAVISKYSDYAGKPGTDDCFIIKSSIYFWQPKDLDAFERTGVLKSRFIDWEIQYAYKQAYGAGL